MLAAEHAGHTKTPRESLRGVLPQYPKRLAGGLQFDFAFGKRGQQPMHSSSRRGGNTLEKPVTKATGDGEMHRA